MTDSVPYQRLCRDVAAALLQAESRPILIAGAGITGRAAARLFLEAGFTVWIVDEKELSPAVRATFSTSTLLENFRDDSPPAVPAFAFVLVSPGVNPRSAFGRWVHGLGAPVFSELDVAFPFLGMPEVAVTGTNGKTTVVSLIARMLQVSKLPAELVGNVGMPFVGKIPASALRVGATAFGVVAGPKWIAELSSYQLETLRVVSPRVAMILNIDDDHLERHGSLEQYLAAKARIMQFQDQRSSYSLLNADEAWSFEVARSCTGKVVWFGSRNDVFPEDWQGCLFDRERNVLLFRGDKGQQEFSLEKTKLIGLHNKLNLAAAVAGAMFCGAEPRAVQQVIDDFPPLEHRVEFVRDVDGIRFINDSKGTNVSSVKAALDMIGTEYPDSGIVLLLGGKMKEGDWSGVKERLNGSVRTVIAFGADRSLVLERLGLETGNGSRPAVFSSENLAEAVSLARSQAEPGDVVLLSPGCASFDAYSDFAARGRHFKELVGALPKR
jgi:UDP-N-acetylmuramoylalanine--D-glutamate ligase